MTDFEVLATMPQDDLSRGGSRPPVLQEKHVFITHAETSIARDWALRMQNCLEDAGFKVAVLGEDDAGSLEKVATSIRLSQKVIMLIDREYIQSEMFKQTLNFIEQLTSERQREILIPVLSRIEYKDLPPQLQYGSAVPVIGLSGDYPKAAEQSWETIVALLTKEVPVLSTVTGGVAYGLAWGYYFGYLHLILPGLSARIEQAYAENKADWDCRETAQLFSRMMMIVPKSVRALSSLTQYDAEIQTVKSNRTGEPIKVKHTIDFPGHPRKDYSCTIFKATVHGKEYLFFAEIPTTLNTLAKMRDSELVTFGDEDHERELTRFQASLEGILMTHRDEHTQARLNSIKILKFDDTKDRLSEMIAREIECMAIWEKSPWKPISQ